MVQYLKPIKQITIKDKLVPDTILPTLDYEQSYLSYINELVDEERYPFVMDFDHQPFSRLIQRLQNLAAGVAVPAGAVINHTYWLVENSELIGVANLRPLLTPAIEHIGGHIGLGIRPTFRGKGYSKILLQSTLEKASGFGLKEVSVHAYKNNHASVAMLESCGAALDSSVADNSGETIQRFIIQI